MHHSERRKSHYHHHGTNVKKRRKNNNLQFIIVYFYKLPSAHVVDATPGEEQAIPLKLLLFFAFPDVDRPMLQGTRMIGPGQLSLPYLKRLMKVRTPVTCSASHSPVNRSSFLVPPQEGEGYALQLVSALNNQLKDV